LFTFFTNGYLKIIIGIYSWVAHANTSVFGEDAMMFQPERWLESKEKALVLDKYFLSVRFTSHFICTNMEIRSILLTAASM
tara:strand:- start:565 stop:807 length:243 start_codon:yes stop_codon:yes gene_type:complete